MTSGSTVERKVYIITGISGAGKSQALKCFEDFGFFCIDNLPIALMDHFANLLANSPHLNRVALGMDIREGRFLAGLPAILNRLKARGVHHRILFLEASDAVVIQRFSETRHRHPLGKKVDQAIRKERQRLIPLKEIADKVIDTSSMTLGELKERLSETLELTRAREMALNIVSFGYKHGLPMDADIVMDVRFLPNPNYVVRLRQLTGLNVGVQRYILSQPIAKKFLGHYLKLINALLPHYVREGKSYLTIAVGCTGGHHRSVFVTHYLAQKLRTSGHSIQEFHRDINQ
ncbi:MAG TPA: RNase adapter RapZ [Elusimicrobia bacterium]|nr:RNase adapter RapZ [Elusimicrobiota bacterium]HBT61858.1 RNase adapter RapZ [Elusimicrobiota bacterium]